MATIPLTIPDAQVDRITTALGWPGAATDGETRGQFAKRQIAQILKAHLHLVEANQLRGQVVVPVLDIT